MQLFKALIFFGSWEVSWQMVARHRKQSTEFNVSISALMWKMTWESLAEREREKQTGRGGSEKHVYLLWIGCEGFPSGEVPKVEICSERQRRKEREGGNKKETDWQIEVFSQTKTDRTAFMEKEVMSLVELKFSGWSQSSLANSLHFHWTFKTRCLSQNIRNS